MSKTIEKLVINSPYHEPKEHWMYDASSKDFSRQLGRRSAGYFIAGQGSNDYNDVGEFIMLPMVNEIRSRVKSWREKDYPGITSITRKLIEHWYAKDVRRHSFFFCQLDAIETIIWLKEAEETERRGIEIGSDGGQFTRICTKLCTGGGKTIVMAMLIAWQVCNKVSYPKDTRYSKNIFIVAPGLTVRDRLQVLHTGGVNNDYESFEIVPRSLSDKLHQGKVVINNWQALAWDSEEDLRKKRSVDKRGVKSDEAYARQVLGEMSSAKNILVINDEAHHAWRKNPETKLSREEKKAEEEATIWIQGLDRIDRARKIMACYDFSATPFAPSGKSNARDALFGWIVSDFGLNDGIESGLIKTPRVIVRDDTTPDEKNFLSKFYHIYADEEVKNNLNRDASPETPLPDRVIQAYNLIGRSWRETYEEWKKQGLDVPPVMITVANRTETASRIAYAFNHRHINIEELCAKEYMRQIDSDVLDRMTGEDKGEQIVKLRREISTVGKPGETGEQLRNIISVGMLTEGWDAKTVTHIIGLRAFSSQLLCEQVVGRGLRRSSYDVGEDGLFSPEYVEIFGIPFTYLPQEIKEGDRTPPAPKFSIQVNPNNAQYEITWPNITQIRKELDPQLNVDMTKIEELILDASKTTTIVELAPIIDGKPDLTKLTQIDLEKIEMDKGLRMQTIIFDTARRVYDMSQDSWKEKGTAYGLLGQIFHLVERYLESDKIIIEPAMFYNNDPIKRKIMYILNMMKIVQHLWKHIEMETVTRRVPYFDTSKKIGSTGDMATWWTTKHREVLNKSHISHCVFDSTWEFTEACKLERNENVVAFAKNDHLGFAIQYTYGGIVHKYYPDFLIKLKNGKTLVLETKAVDSAQAHEKRQALKEWVETVNSLAEYGEWCSAISYNVADVGGIINKFCR